ncbi:MAG: glycosyltransferase family 4 protein [Planctomycetes bacterium]|nr:glycosyltransferase family 4 protein [Planctomycetota bacterium]
MRIAVLAPIAWRTPPRAYGPWEQVASNIAEGLVRRGHDVTLFATGDSVTAGRLHAICRRGWEEDSTVDVGVWKLMHIAEAFERADQFDVIHNHFDYPSLTYSRLVRTPVVTTIHGFSSPTLYPAYEKYNANTWYVSISDADRYDAIDYVGTVYNGIDLADFTYSDRRGGHLLWLGRVCHEKGTAEAVAIARRSGRKLILAGIIQEEDYYRRHVQPHVDNDQIRFIGPVGPRDRDELLGRAAALLHPVMRPERFGLVMTEAMACGTPVIGFDKGSVREIVAHGRTGYVVDDVDAAVEAVGRLGDIDPAACRQRVEDHFTCDVMVDGYVDVYRRVLRMHADRQAREHPETADVG